MTTNEWGPNAWKFLHHLTFNYPDNPTPEEQQHVENLFNSLQLLLPCDECKTNFTNELSLFPIDTRSKYSLSNWLVNVHNSVNQRLNKKTITYAEASKLYSSNCTQCNSKNLKQTNTSATTIVFYVAVVFVIVAILLLLLKNHHHLQRLRR